MTLASALFGGGGSGLPYLSGVLYPCLNYSGSIASTINRDYLLTFAPRKSVTVDKVAWHRDQATAANIYVGIYSSAGVLLTNCAVDTDTTVGWHAVDTTNITLLPTQVYFFAINVSADVLTIANTTPGNSADYGGLVQLGVAMSASTGVSGAFKARTNAALLSSLTMSGFTVMGTDIPALGFVPA
ncbi:MAG TPA: hypothetical protein DCL48_09000 [Alphaproteobacteria bacterium]|nr:hypothetical protein [Alphaproteobacteria bacterium]